MYIKGLYLQGAGWDKKNSVLIEADPMQLVCAMPSIHFKPTEAKKKSSKGKRNTASGIWAQTVFEAVERHERGRQIERDGEEGWRWGGGGGGGGRERERERQMHCAAV